MVASEERVAVLYVGDSGQVAQWRDWPGRAEHPGDVLDLDDYLDHGARPPQAFDAYDDIVFWISRDERPPMRQGGWIREQLGRRESLRPDTSTILRPFPPDQEHDVEVARAEGEEASLTATDKRIAVQAKEEYVRLVAHERAKDQRSSELLATVVGDRVKRTAREFAKVPKPQAVMKSILAAEVNLLAGPGAAGKSLLSRDLALCVATGQPWRGYEVPEARDVLLMFSEGTHDFAERYEWHPLWEEAADHVWVLDQPVNLVSGSDTDWLLKEYTGERPGLVVTDVSYGFGMTDDNGSKDVLPFLSSLKRISAEWGAATLAIGHPPHGDARRMRGSSMWRQLAYTDWFLGDGLLTCGKSKIGHAASMTMPYRAEYPALHWLSTGESLAEEARRRAVIEASVAADPSLSVRRRAVRLFRELGIGEDRTRKLITSFLKDKKGLS